MRPTRRILAMLERANAVREAERCGVALTFRALVRREPELEVRDFFDLRDGGEVEAALGLAKLLRLLREARLAGAGVWLGRPEAAAQRLAPALGRVFRLEVVPRSRLRVEVVTEDGTLVVDGASEVLADERAFLVRRHAPAAPLRIERARVVRRQSTLERWLEVRGARRPA
jgi:hypothetical protein